MSNLPWTTGDDPAIRNGAVGRKCRRHEWTPRNADGESWCVRCSAIRDPAASRRGRSADRLGKDQERRIERTYGPRKVGEYGDPVDHLGRDFKWQSKATRGLPPKWLAAITAPMWRPILPKAVLGPMAHMVGIGGARRPLVIRSFVHHGVATRDWLFARDRDWWAFHQGSGAPSGGFLVPTHGYLVIPGADFLELHGRDEP